MLCVITHIREDLFNNSNENYRKKVNTFINTLFSNLYDDELNETIDTFWSEYTNFNNNIDPFDSY